MASFLRPAGGRLSFLRPSMRNATLATATLSSLGGARGPLMQAAVRNKSGPYGYTQAKALVFSQFGEPADVLSLHTHSISPELPAKAALIRTLAAPINPADINTVQGTYGSKPTFTPLLGTPQPSAVPGGEGCFEVVAVGSDVQTLRPGYWALPAAPGMGTWRTHALVEDADTALLAVAKPEGLVASEAATATVNPVTAWRLLRDFEDLVALSVQQGRGAGAWFVQNGANSGVGRAAIQLGRLWGLRSVNVVRARETPEATEALRRELTELGATLVVTEDELQERGFAKRLLTDISAGSGQSDGIRLGLNCVGGRSALGVSKCLAEGGCLVTYGAMAKQPVTAPAGLLIFRDLSFRGFWVSRWGTRNPEARRQTVQAVLELMRTRQFVAGPAEEIPWTWDTPVDTLKKAVSGTLEGYRSGKGIFVFKDT